MSNLSKSEHEPLYSTDNTSEICSRIDIVPPSWSKCQFHLSRRNIAVTRLFQIKTGRYLPYYFVILLLIACISTILLLYFVRSPIQSNNRAGYQGSPIQSNNWAGYQASSNRRGVYSEANMIFTVPRLKATQGQNT